MTKSKYLTFVMKITWCNISNPQMSEKKVNLSKENQTFVVNQKEQECNGIIASEKLLTYNDTSKILFKF